MNSGEPSFSINNKPRVALFAECDVLALSILEKLLANFCQVKIYCQDIDLWREKTRQLGYGNFFSFVSLDKELEGQNIHYLIYVNLFSQGKSDEKIISQILDYTSRTLTKTILVLPYFLETEEQKNFCAFVKTKTKDFENLGTVYVGQIVSPRMVLKRGYFVHEILSDILRGEKPKVPDNNFEVYPSFAPDISRELVKSLFSFGYFGQEIALFSAKTTADNFVQLLLVAKNVMGTLSTSPLIPKTPSVNQEILLAKSLESFLPETLSWFEKNPAGILPPPKVSQAKPSKKAPTRSLPRRLYWFKDWRVKVVLLVFLLFLLLPYFGLTLSALSFWGLEKAADRGNFYIAEKGATLAGVSANLTKKQSAVLKGIPLLGVLYQYTETLAEISQSASRVAQRGMVIAQEGRIVIKNIFSQDAPDIFAKSETIVLDLDFLYQELGFLQGEIANLDPFSAKIINPILEKLDFAKIRREVFFAKEIGEALPDLLGRDESKTYLLLLQNNMELRPTGGFIGSFALLTFEHGRFTGSEVSDVYEADGQLKGHVEPPEAIRKYLGEANWYLRDSNWDPDFPVSASRAEWFLDKEIGKKVDGVLAIDLAYIKALLAVTGPLALPDYDQTIGAQNLYEKTQEEVEKNFFPGSQKKANYLSALSRALLLKVQNPQERDLFSFAKASLSAFTEKHLQIFVHNAKAKNALADLIWDGAVNWPTCEGNCLPDWLGLIDANVGVNKGNYNLERKLSLAIRFDEDFITRELTINFENKANPALGSSARYKTYLRVLAPTTSIFAETTIKVGDKTKSALPEINEIRGRKEAGVLVEIPAGQNAEIRYLWQSPRRFSFSEPGQYLLYLRKQAGTNADPFSININFPAGVKVKAEPNFGLTEGATLKYNSSLLQDFLATLKW